VRPCIIKRIRRPPTLAPVAAHLFSLSFRLYSLLRLPPPRANPAPTPSPFQPAGRSRPRLHQRVHPERISPSISVRGNLLALRSCGTLLVCVCA
jgi:hypothetical protein